MIENCVTSVSNIRFQEYDVYIGRAGHGHDGYFGNPIVLGKCCPVCDQIHTKSGETLECFRVYFYLRIGGDPEFRTRVMTMLGKRLGCFCKPRPCHGDVIAEYLNGVYDE